MATPKKSPKAAKPATPASKPDAKADKPVHIAPVVNLTNAAQSAAVLIAARSKRAAATGSSGGAVSASAMKQIKNSIAQPQHAPTSLLAGLNKQPKPTGTAGYNRVGGHHQNNGANVARTGVPRRTGGG